MAYFVPQLSFVPRNCPTFVAVNADGSAFKYKDFARLYSGRPVAADTTPSLGSIYRHAQLDGSSKQLPDICHAGPLVCVNRTMRDLIEALEPNVHQFLSIELRKKNKEPFEGEYWIINICALLDAVVFEKSNLRWARTTHHEYVERGLSAQDFRTVKKSVVADHHIWRDEIYPADIYLSDLLYLEMRRLKIRGIDKDSYKKVDSV